MNSEFVQAAGGLGLFLIGMVILTEGLRGLAGESLQRSMRRFTRSPVSGAFTGMGITALIQSSSATTVAAVGFAGAGLLTFPQALGLVFGANVGTTVTGWAVALLGFKLDLSSILPPLILAGALLRLFGRGRVATAGYALAGFGLIFLGIDLLAAGMGSLQGVFSPDRFPPGTIAGRFALVGLGVVMTIVTQSSSAGVATALTALHTDTIGLVQACALVIGMDVGTTVTAVFAAIGGTVAARRTASAHVVFNLLIATGAFVILPLYMIALGQLLPGTLERNPELCLVGFHTLFNLIGLVVVLPAAGPFARLLERIVPDQPTRWTERLDPALLRDPAVALRAVTPTLGELTHHAFEMVRDGLRGEPPVEARRGILLLAVEQTRAYLARIETPSRGGLTDARELSVLHLIDQLRRLLSRLRQRERMQALGRETELVEQARRVAPVLSKSLDDAAASAIRLAEIESDLAADRDESRRQLLDRAARGEIDSSEAISRMDARRWLERVTHHVARILHHMDQVQRDRPSASRAEVEPEAEAAPEEPDSTATSG